MPLVYDGAQETLDGILNHAIVVRQRRFGHRAGTDTVLLAVASAALLRAFCSEGDSIERLRNGSIQSMGSDGGRINLPAMRSRERRVVDLGAGVGTVGLIMAKKVSSVHVFLVECDPILAQMARDNVFLNGLETRTSVVEANILASSSERRLVGLLPQMADMVVTNPPFLCTSRPFHAPGANGEHVISPENLEYWFRVAADLLVPFGVLICIYRADGFSRLLSLLEKRFGDLFIRPIHAYENHPAIRFLVMARKGSRAPLRFLPPLVLHKADGHFTDEVEALHRGDLAPMMGSCFS